MGKAPRRTHRHDSGMKDPTPEQSVPIPQAQLITAALGGPGVIRQPCPARVAAVRRIHVAAVWRIQ